MDDLGHRICGTQAHSALAYLSERRWTARAEHGVLGPWRFLIRSGHHGKRVAERTRSRRCCRATHLRACASSSSSRSAKWRLMSTLVKLVAGLVAPTTGTLHAVAKQAQTLHSRVA